MGIEPNQESTGTKEIIHIYVVLNPVAGHSNGDDLRRMLEERFNSEGYRVDIYETTGEEDVAQLTRDACTRGSKLVIAAGGDGTVAGVVNGLMHNDVPLGVIPLGTGNGLARALNIPLDIGEAIDIIAVDNHQIQGLDALKVGEKFFILNVSAGISAKAMEETDHTVKQRFGVLAYVWSIAKQLFGFQPRRFWVTIDGRRALVRAAEILVSNGTLLEEPLPLGPPELFNDGVLDVYVITPRTIVDYLVIAWHFIVHRNQKRPLLRHLTAKQSVMIEAYREPQPTQADGESLGTTPVEVEIVRDALQVIVPPKE